MGMFDDWLKGFVARSPNLPPVELPGGPPKLVPVWPSGAIRWTSAHAYTPNEQGHYGGGHHVVLEEAFHRGRLHRDARDALCKPFRKFGGWPPRAATVRAGTSNQTAKRASTWPSATGST